MSDIRCRKCGEPWEIDTLHDVVAEHNEIHPQDGLTFPEVYKSFARSGCKTITGKECGGPGNTTIDSIYDLMGDDVDGAAAMIEDAEFMGLL